MVILKDVEKGKEMKNFLTAKFHCQICETFVKSQHKTLQFIRPTSPKYIWRLM